VDGGVLGGEADGAGVVAGLARLAQAQVAARQQQHRRLPLPARLARPLGVVLGLQAAGLRVAGFEEFPAGLAKSLDDTTSVSAEHEVECGAELRGDGLVGARDAAPRLALAGRLPEALLQLRAPAARGVQLPIHLPQPAADRARQLHALPLPRVLQPGAEAGALGSHQRVDLGALPAQLRQQRVLRRRQRCRSARRCRRRINYPARFLHRLELLNMIRFSAALPRRQHAAAAAAVACQLALRAADHARTMRPLERTVVPERPGLLLGETAAAGRQALSGKAPQLCLHGHARIFSMASRKQRRQEAQTRPEREREREREFWRRGGEMRGWSIYKETASGDSTTWTTKAREEVKVWVKPFKPPCFVFDRILSTMHR
jgi:hypothetical protein